MDAVLYNAFELENGAGNIELENGRGVIVLESYFIPGQMPNLVGVLLQEALEQLQWANILVPSAIGYFGTYPVTVTWQAASGTRGFVTAQSIAAGTPNVPVNAPIALTVNDFATAVVFP